MSKYSQHRRLTILLSLLLLSVVALFVINHKQQHQPSFSSVAPKIVGNKPTELISNTYKSTNSTSIDKHTHNQASEIKNSDKSEHFYSELEKAVELSKFQKIFYEGNAKNIWNIPVEVTSEWEKIQTKRHINSINSSDYNLIVLPLQQRRLSFDRVGRIMSSRWLAAEMERKTRLKIMSPELALRILGERNRSFDATEIQELAMMADANVLALYLDNNPEYDVDLKKNKIYAVLTGSDGLIKNKILLPLQEITVNNPLEENIRHLSKQIIASLVDEKDIITELKEETADTKQVSYQMPDTFDQFDWDKLKPVQHALYLQLFALMTPAMLSYERDRLFERSLLALEDVNSSMMEYRLLKARALFHITRKPQALEYLNHSTTHAELALRAYVNGNYTEIKNNVHQINEPVFQLLAYLELKEIQYEYNIEDDYKIAHIFGKSHWNALIASLARDKDKWYAPDNFTFFSNLKGLYRQFDEFFEKSVNAQIVSGGIEYVKTNGAILQKILHNKRLGHETKNCCSRYGGRLENSDIWDLYRNFALANTLRKLNRSVNVHESFGTAYHNATELEPILTGHPRFTVLYAEASRGLASTKTDSENIFFLEKAIALADKVLFYSGAADFNTLRAEIIKREVSNAQPKMAEAYKYLLLDLENKDVPRSYTIFAKRILSSSSAKALPYDHTNFNILKFTSNSEKWSDEKLIDYLHNHYEGHPDHAIFLANRMMASHQSDEAISVLKSVIKKDSTNWKSRTLLVNLLIQSSKYHEAEKILAEYFEKNDSNLHRVDKSNRAYDAGNRFYWLGRHEEAIQFYQLSGSLSTGAESGYASRQRLALMEHDYATALEYAFRRGKRYNSRYGYRDYLAILHLIGAHEDALSGFANLVSRYDSPPLWTSLFIGRRIQKDAGSQYSSIVEEALSNSSETLRQQAARYVFLDKITDRIPNASDIQYIPDVKFLKSQTINLDNVIQNLAIDTGVVSFSTKCPEAVTDCIEKDGSNLQQIDNDDFRRYSNYMDAYVSYKEKNYKSAFIKYLKNNGDERILRVRSVYNQDGKLLSLLKTNHTLPYLAISATESEYNSFLEALHKKIKSHQVDNNSAFDIFLTEAIIYASSQQWDESLNLLKRAFHKRPHTKWRPVYSWYQITEIAEWIYRFSNDKRFLDLALDWAKRYQVIQPQFAWAYAFEALHSENRNERIRAAGFAQYLDKDSHWLSKVPVNIKKEGKQWWKENNPFTLNYGDEEEKVSI